MFLNEVVLRKIKVNYGTICILGIGIFLLNPILKNLSHRRNILFQTKIFKPQSKEVSKVYLKSDVK